jgi:cation-transporting ATPase 13A3/4/5
MIRFGKCLVQVPKKTIVQILLDEVLNPFYIFQVFSICVFIWEEYTIYAGCIFVLSTLSICSTIYETRRNNEQIRKMARYICEIEVMKLGPDGS